MARENNDWHETVMKLKMDGSPLSLEAARVIEEQANQVWDARATLSNWFDIKNRLEEDIPDIVKVGFQTYLKVSTSGGMDSTLADCCEAILCEWADMYAGTALTPVVRQVAEELGSKILKPGL